MRRTTAVYMVVFLTGGSAAGLSVSNATPSFGASVVATYGPDRDAARRKAWVKRSINRFFEGGADIHATSHAAVDRVTPWSSSV